MTPDDLAARYRAYIACLNARDWFTLSAHVHDAVEHNGRAFGLAGYRAMLEADVQAIPDLRFEIAQLVCEPPVVAARLAFACRPTGDFLGLPVNGRHVTFGEHVFYGYTDGHIRQVWSVIDRAAIAAQIAS